MLKYTSAALICCLLAVFAQAAPEGRIVGGTDATDGQFPHQISLREFDFHICGGSIISENYILTAAHCVAYLEEGAVLTYSPERFSVYAGSNNRLEGGIDIKVAEVIAHKEYGSVLKNDIALLRLAEPLTFTNKMHSIPLATAETPQKSPVIISGWGRLYFDGPSPTKLQWNVVSAMSSKECHNVIHTLSNSFICLAHELDNGACMGDSGGPATHNNELIGICSFSMGGCGSESPDGYTHVLQYLDWIKENSDWSE